MMDHANTLTQEDVKNTAKIIRETLKNKFNVEIKHGWALETSSAVYGYKDWNTASADLLQGEEEARTSSEAFKNTLASLDPRSRPSKGFISGTAFDRLLARNAIKYGLAKSDSMVKTTTIRQIAKEIGIGKDLVFTIGLDNEASDAINISENTTFADFGLLVGEKRKAIRLSRLFEMDAPREIIEHEENTEIQLGGLNIHGIMESNELAYSINVSSPDSILDDYVYLIITQRLDEGEAFSIYSEGIETDVYQDAFKKASIELFGNLQNKLYAIRLSSAHNYKEALFITPDSSIFKNYGVDDIETLLKNELGAGDRKGLVESIAKQAKILSEIIISDKEAQK